MNLPVEAKEKEKRDRKRERGEETLQPSQFPACQGTGPPRLPILWSDVPNSELYMYIWSYKYYLAKTYCKMIPVQEGRGFVLGSLW